jgi:tetratricopeptide (TPR) repeat protein
MSRSRIGRWPAAVAVSLTLMGLAALAQPDSGGTAREVLAQAALQARLDELDAAEQSYLEAIQLIVSSEGEFSRSLIEAYRGLAEVFARRGDHPEAVTVLEQARHISNRNFGLFNLDQLEILDELSAVYEDAGDTRQAQETQRERLAVAERHFGADDAGVVPYRFRLAQYYELARMRGLAREQYEEALAILAADPGTRPAQTLRPLRELVRIDTLLGERTGAQRRLTEALASITDAPPLERAASLAVLGDAELVAGAKDEAFALYTQAYAAIPDPEAAKTFFASPQMIDFVPPAGAVDFSRSADREYAWGSITLTFALSAQGRAHDIHIVTSVPPGLMDARYTQRLAEATFRPRLAAGAPAATARLRYFHEFRYFVPDTG